MTEAMSSSPDLANLAEWVTRRRRELDLTQLEVWNRGGPSNSTLTAIEAGRSPAPSRSTLKKLDRALQWVDGSAKACLSGGKPTPVVSDLERVRMRIDQTLAELQHEQLLLREVRQSDEQSLVDRQPMVERASQRVADLQATLDHWRLEEVRLATLESVKPTVGAQGKDADSLLYRRPDGVSDAEWERIRDQSRDYIEWLIEKAARER